MIIMNTVDVAIFITAHVLSTKPQVTSSETRPESEVTLAINLPTDVWL
jgi:hypothetical protein